MQEKASRRTSDNTVQLLKESKRAANFVSHHLRRLCVLIPVDVQNAFAWKLEIEEPDKKFSNDYYLISFR